MKSYKIKELYVFGSILGNNFNDESDIDILISFQNDANYSLLEFIELRERLEAFFNRSVDLVEKESLKNPYRRKEILKTARIFYEHH